MAHGHFERELLRRLAANLDVSDFVRRQPVGKLDRVRPRKHSRPIAHVHTVPLLAVLPQFRVVSEPCAGSRGDKLDAHMDGGRQLEQDLLAVAGGKRFRDAQLVVEVRLGAKLVGAFVEKGLVFGPKLEYFLAVLKGMDQRPPMLLAALHEACAHARRGGDRNGNGRLTRRSDGHLLRHRFV